ncbi:ABC transporter permease [Streptomyces sp. ODS28]|uniref:ABC transporter permease n=1 Tax=Streptomyces sp. ODS28 TaxID=3136688 RepID=UPI0031E9373E
MSEPHPHPEPDPEGESGATRAPGSSSGAPRTSAPEEPRPSEHPDGENPHGENPDGEHPHGAHGRLPTGAEKWRSFKKSPYLPALVLMLILGAAAGLFAGSYTYAMADPTPHHVPVAVVGKASSQKESRTFIQGMEKALGSSLKLHHYSTYQRAEQDIEEQRVFAVLRVKGDSRVEMDISSASGASVAQVLQQAGPQVGKKAGVQVAVKDLKPLNTGDPRGLSVFYISLAAVIIGFVGAIQLSVHARALAPLERIGFTIAYALLGGFVIAAVVDWLLGALHLPFVHSWMILSLTMFTSGMVFTMFNTLFGRWAMIPTWGLMVLLGNPSSGGAVSWPLLPSVLGTIGRWLPPGASVNAQHTAVYFPGHQHLQPYLVLAAWALVSCAVFWTWRHRHPGGRTAGAHAAAPSGS